MKVSQDRLRENDRAHQIILHCYIILLSGDTTHKHETCSHMQTSGMQCNYTIILLDQGLNVVTDAWLKLCGTYNHTAEPWTIFFVPHIIWNRDSVDCTARLRAGKGKLFFSTPQRSDRLRGPQSLLVNAYRRLSRGGQSVQGKKVFTFLHLVPTLRINGAKPPLEHMLSWHTSVQL